MPVELWVMEIRVDNMQSPTPPQGLILQFTRLSYSFRWRAVAGQWGESEESLKHCSRFIEEKQIKNSFIIKKTSHKQTFRSEVSLSNSCPYPKDG